MASQYVAIDLHRRRSVIVRQTPEGEVVATVRIDNDPVALAYEVAKAGADPEVVLEATYGWYWAVDVLQACGATVHLAHPLGVKGFSYRRVNNDVRDAEDLVDRCGGPAARGAGSRRRARVSYASWCGTARSSSRCVRG